MRIKGILLWAPTDLMAATFPRYSQLLSAAARRKGVYLLYSQPEVVNGGSCPPPSRIYPGQSCYMITLTIGAEQSHGNGKAVECHGFGPSPAIARCAAESKAYKVLTSSSCDEQQGFVGRADSESVSSPSTVIKGDKSEEIAALPTVKAPSVPAPQAKDYFPVSLPSGRRRSSAAAAASDDCGPPQLVRDDSQRSPLVRQLDGRYQFCSRESEARPSPAVPTVNSSTAVNQVHCSVSCIC